MSGTDSLGSDPRWNNAMRNLASAVISGAPPIAQAGRCTISGARGRVNCTVEYAPNIGFLDVGEHLRNAATHLLDVWFDHNSLFPGLTFTLTKQPDGDWNIEIDFATATAPPPEPVAREWDQDSEFDVGDFGAVQQQSPGGYQNAGMPPQGPGGFQNQPLQGTSGGYQNVGMPPQGPGGFQNQPPQGTSGGYQNVGMPPQGPGGFQNQQQYGGSPAGDEFQSEDAHDGYAHGEEGDAHGDSGEAEPKAPRKPRIARSRMVSEKKQASPQTIKLIALSIAAVILLAGIGTGVYFLLTQKPEVKPVKTFEEERKDFETELTKRAEAPQEYDNTAPDAVKEVEYPSGDRMLSAWLILPDREPPFPAVVFAHDGFARSRADYTTAIPFVSHGFAVMIPAWRGENGNPGDFEMCYGEVDDLVAAVKYLSTRKKIDKGSIFAAGHGVGATNVMLAAELSPHLRKVAACGGRPDMFDAGEAYEHAPFDQRNHEERLMRSPQRFLKDLKCPMLLLYAEKDPGHKFFYDQALKMAKDSKAQPILVEELPGVNHQTSLAPAVQRMITFFHAR